MHVNEIANRVAHITRNVDDPEVAHAQEDQLFAEVLKAIAAGAPNAQEMAQAAIKSLDLKFPRWCA